MAWEGVRIQVNCGHYDLRDASLDPAPRIGQLYPCTMCPATLHSRATPGVPATAVRFIVEIVPVTAVQRPDPWGPEHWYGGLGGNVDLKVEVSNVSADDVVSAVFDDVEGVIRPQTLGEVITQALLDRLTRDPRWDGLAERFWDSVDGYMRDQAPAAVEALVAAEVTRQLESSAQGAVTRGKRSTRAEAYISTEVATQLRDRFGPLVERALANLAHDLQVLSGDAVEAFMKGSGGPLK